jgi:hypothetical protein
VNGPVGNPVTQIEKRRKGEASDQYHNRCPVHFLLAGPRDPLHLNLDFLVVVPKPLPRSASNNEFVCHIELNFGLKVLLPHRTIGWLNGRGGGIRTPTTGFGDRQSSR